VQHVGGSDIPTDLAPIAPVAVPSGNGAAPAAGAA